MTARSQEQAPRTGHLARHERQRLIESEKALQAIRGGHVDHLIVAGPDGPGIVRLQSSRELELQQDLRQAQALAKLGTWTYNRGILAWSDQMYVLHDRDLALGPPSLTGGFLLFAPSSAARLEAAARKALQTGSGFALDLELHGGAGRWCRVQAEAIHEDGAWIGLRGTAQDTTDQRKAEAERERLRALDIEVDRLKGLNEMRSDFLNAAAHDLNNPLTPIMVQMAVMARNAGPDARQQASIAVLQRNFKRLQVLIQDMLVASRLQSGRMNLHWARHEMRGQLEQAIESFQAVAAAGGVTLTLEAPTPVDVVMDQERVGQVLYNLLSNAIKYTPVGGNVRVSLSAGGGLVRVKVTDSGIGMTADQLARLFQPFVRLHEHVPGTAKGTGLGLYICKGLNEAHGGRMLATSPGPGLGSTFTMELPQAGPRA